MSYAPIVLFVYNRPDHTKRIYDCLRKNPECAESDLYIISDGPKEDAKESVDKVRRLITTFEGFKNIHITNREENWGIERSQQEAITRIVGQHGKIIVLEDDLELNPGFLKYMNDALNKYEGSKRVFSVTGYSYERLDDSFDDAFFLNLPSSWGWGTWKDKWDTFEMPPSDIKALYKSSKLQRRFDCNGAYPWFRMLAVIYKNTGEITWDLCWHWSIIKNNGLVLYPRENLSINGGFDGSGVHCKDKKRDEVLSIQPIIIDDFPEDETLNKRAYDAIRIKMRKKRTKLQLLKELYFNLFKKYFY